MDFIVFFVKPTMYKRVKRKLRRPTHRLTPAVEEAAAATATVAVAVAAAAAIEADGPSTPSSATVEKVVDLQTAPVIPAADDRDEPVPRGWKERLFGRRSRKVMPTCEAAATEDSNPAETPPLEDHKEKEQDTMPVIEPKLTSILKFTMELKRSLAFTDLLRLSESRLQPDSSTTGLIRLVRVNDDDDDDSWEEETAAPPKPPLKPIPKPRLMWGSAIPIEACMMKDTGKATVDDQMTEDEPDKPDEPVIKAGENISWNAEDHINIFDLRDPVDRAQIPPPPPPPEDETQ